MLLDAGIVTIYRITAVDADGGLPEETYSEVFKSCYGEKVVGFSRYFTAQSVNDQIDLLLEIQRYRVSNADIVEVESITDPDTNGFYKVIQVQHIDDTDGLPVTDLSLQRLEGVNDPNDLI